MPDFEDDDTRRFRDLRAVFVNCSLEHARDRSHTMRLVERAASVMRARGVETDIVHALEHRIAFGMAADMSAEGHDDDWPALRARILAADIFVMATPIWLGVKSSVATLVTERMYASSSQLDERGQLEYYGRVAGCLVTGNEDGIKAVARDVLYSLQHIGYAIPPQADAGWIGEAGPGPSYGDRIDGEESPAGYDNEFTNRNTTTMAWNLMHLAALLRRAGGFPLGGNEPDHWRDTTNAAEFRPAPLD